MHGHAVTLPPRYVHGPASHLTYRSMDALNVGMSSCSVHNVGVRFLPHSACGPTTPLSPRCLGGPAVLPLPSFYAWPRRARPPSIRVSACNERPLLLRLRYYRAPPLRSVQAPAVSMFTWSVHNATADVLARSVRGPAAPLSPRSVSGPAAHFDARSMHGPDVTLTPRSVHGSES